MTDRGNRFHVAVALGLEHKVHRDIVSGVLRFAATRDKWEIRILPYAAFSSAGADAVGAWRIDGVIAGTPPRDFMRGRKLPFVVIDPRSDQERRAHATIRTGDLEIGTAAAEFLLSRHFTHFAYAPSTDPGENHHCRLRERGFAQRLQERGQSHRHIDILSPGSASLKPLSALASELEGLPKPCALFAYNDIAARHVLDASHCARLAVPESLAILGVDDQREIAECTRPQLSSVLPDFEASGFAAAETLDRLLSGKSPRSRTVTTGVVNVIERASTRDQCGSRRIVSAALDYMKLHFHERLTTRRLAGHLNVSARLLEMRFRETLGQSVHGRLTEIRLREAARLQSQSPIPVADIAERCGYASPAGFRKASRKNPVVPISSRP